MTYIDIIDSNGFVCQLKNPLDGRDEIDNDELMNYLPPTSFTERQENIS